METAETEILSSSERHWDQLVDEAKDAERYSRRLARRILEGYASKQTKARDPGGHPPFGFRRNAAKLLEPDPERLPLVRRAYELSARDVPDRMVAEQTGLPLFTVRGLLTSPLYVGRLRDGGPAHWAPVVPLPTWELVQAHRARRATKSGQRADPRRPYTLDMLHSAGCGARLTGDTGYYRHRQPCAAFVAARSAIGPRRGRSPGHAYRMELYEQVVEGILAEVAVGAGTLTAVVGHLTGAPTPPSQDHGRLDQERQRVLAQYVRDRDAAKLDREMTRLDREAMVAAAPDPAAPIPTDVAVRYLRALPDTWRRANGGPGRAQLARALFARIDVLGLQEATVHLTDHAVRHGFAAALPGELRLLVCGRGERI